MNSLVITPEMIEVFNYCTKQQNYNEFYDMYKTDIEICAQRLEHLEIPKNTLCHFITQNVSELFTILTANSSCDHRKLAAGCCGVELQQPEFIDDLKKAIEKKDWQPFYDKYRKYADTIIKEARRQRFLNVLIEWRSEPYLNLESRDKAILDQNNDSGRRSVNRASSSVEDRNGMRLLPYEPEDGGNNEIEVSPGGPGSSSVLEDFGEIGVIASETPEELVMELPGRIDHGQSTSSGSFFRSSDSSNSYLRPRESSSNEEINDRPIPNLNLQEETPGVNTSEIKIAELREEFSTILDSLRRNNEIQAHGGGLPSSPGVLNVTNTSRAKTSNNDLQQKLEDELDRHTREMRRLAKFHTPEMEGKHQATNNMMEDFDNYERKEKYKYLSEFESTSRNPPLEKEIPEKSPQETKLQENEFEEYEKEMSKLLNDVLKQHPTEEKNGVEESSEEHPPDTILDMITDFIEKMWEG